MLGAPLDDDFFQFFAVTMCLHLVEQIAQAFFFKPLLDVVERLLDA